VKIGSVDKGRRTQKSNKELSFCHEARESTIKVHEIIQELKKRDKETKESQNVHK
jgi:hypothetical protein